MTKQPPSRRQHVELGARLQDARDAVADAMMLTSRCYPHTSKVSRRAIRALDALDDLRNELDSASARELPRELWSQFIYYHADRAQRADWLAEHPLDD